MSRTHLAPRLAAILLAASVYACGGTSAEKAEMAESSADTNAPKSAVTSTQKAAPAPTTATLPANSAVIVQLGQALTTETNTAGDAFEATLSEPLVVNGKTVAGTGAKIHGTVVEANRAGRVKGTALMSLQLTDLVIDGKKHDLSTEPLILEADPNKTKDAAAIAGGAVAGAVMGGATGGKDGAVKGGVIGGAAGTGYALLTKGEDLKLESGAKLRFILQSSLTLPVK